MTAKLDISGAAEWLNVSTLTVRRILPKLKHYRTDFGLRFDPADLQAYMDQFAVEPKAPAHVDLDAILPRRRRTG